MASPTSKTDEQNQLHPQLACRSASQEVAASVLIIQFSRIAKYQRAPYPPFLAPSTAMMAEVRGPIVISEADS